MEKLKKMPKVIQIIILGMIYGVVGAVFMLSIGVDLTGWLSTVYFILAMTGSYITIMKPFSKK